MKDFAWFFIAVLLASPNTGSYTFLLLFLPLMLLLENADRRTQVFWSSAMHFSLYLFNSPGVGSFRKFGY